MSAPTLTRHGEHVKPHYAPVEGETTSWAGQSTDTERPDGQVTGIVKRYDKSEQACAKSISFGLIKTIYAHAIKYTARPQGLRGLSLIAGILGATLGFGFGIWQFIEEVNAPSHNVFDTIAIVFPLMFIAFGVFMIIWTTRLELFSPEDEPTIFDRKNRKVYRIFRETQPGLKGLFKRWPLRAAEYDWNLIDVEHNATLVTTGSTVMRHHALVFIVRKSATDPTIIDSFNIGNSMELGEHTVPAVWEHIRRFMEESGSPLPPGESLMLSEPPQTFWQSVGAVGPFGPKYALWWREQLPFMVLIHALFPFFVPFFLLWGFFNWLSYKTATPIEWPQEVQDAIGPAIECEQESPDSQSPTSDLSLTSVLLYTIAVLAGVVGVVNFFHDRLAWPWGVAFVGLYFLGLWRAAKSSAQGAPEREPSVHALAAKATRPDRKKQRQ